MKLVNFVAADQVQRLGIVQDSRVYDLATAWNHRGEAPPWSNMIEFLTAGESALEAAGELAERAEKESLPHYPLHDVVIKAPIPRPPRIWCLADNFRMSSAAQESADEIKPTPLIFIKPSTSVIDPGGTIFLPRISDQVDYEIELAAVIGRRGKYISVDRAMDYVVGYTMFNDISARSMTFAGWRRRGADEDSIDWMTGKWMDTFGPMGPYLVLKQAIPDPHALRMTLKVNGNLKQDGSTGQMINRIPELVSFISHMVALEPGDLISTGTCSGKGVETGVFLKPGDVMVGEIEGLGILQNTVVTEPNHIS